MRERILRRVQILDAPIDEAFDFFSRAENLEAITPPLLKFRIVTEGSPEMEAGTLIRYRLRVHRLPISWLTRIQAWDPPRGFVDQQLKGPYALWHHTHSFEPVHSGDGVEMTRMTDLVRYGQRFGPFGTLAEHLIVRRDLDTIFDFRRDRIPELLARGGA